MEVGGGSPRSLRWILAARRARSRPGAGVVGLERADRDRDVSGSSWSNWALIEAVGLGSARTAALASTLRGALAAPERISLDAFVFRSGGSRRLLAVAGGGRAPAAGGWLILVTRPAAIAAASIWWGWPRPCRNTGRSRCTRCRGNLHLPLDHPTWGAALSGPAFLQRRDLVEPTAGGHWDPADRADQAALADQLGEPWAAAVRAGPPAASCSRRTFGAGGDLRLRAASSAAEDDREAERLKARAFALLRRLALAAAHHRGRDYCPRRRFGAQVVGETAPVLQTDAIQRVVAGHAYTATVLVGCWRGPAGRGLAPPPCSTG